jgi:hypothetical protein
VNEARSEAYEAAFKTSAMLYFDYEARYAWQGSVATSRCSSVTRRSC